MRNSLKLASAVAAVVGISFSMPLFAAENPCAGLKGEEASKCRKEQRAADTKAGKGAAPTGTPEVAGGGGKGTPRADRTKDKSGAMGGAPKGTSEAAGGEGKGTPRADRTKDKSGAMGGAPKGASETATK